MEYPYVIASASLLTWFRWNQHIQGRSYPFVGMSCLYGVWMLANGVTIPLDGVTVGSIALAVWMLASILWSQKTLCIYELFNWFSYLLLFTAARQIPTEHAMWVLIPNSILFAAWQLWNHRKYELTDEAKLYPVFGNSNHNAAFLLVGFYASLWLAEKYPFMYVASLVMGCAIVLSRRRGPLLALISSLLAAILLTGSEAIVYLLLIIVFLAIPNRQRIMNTFNGMLLSDRWEIYKHAWSKIGPRYLMGRGLNYYRDTKYGRVHNDFLELTGEIGIIGLALFGNVFLQMNLSPIMVCAVVAYFIDAMFFYPLRETHTAAPFWVMAGSATGVGLPSSLLPLQIAGILSVAAIGLFVFTVYSNLVKWTAEEARKRESERVDRAAPGQGAGSGGIESAGNRAMGQRESRVCQIPLSP